MSVINLELIFIVFIDLLLWALIIWLCSVCGLVNFLIVVFWVLFLLLASSFMGGEKWSGC